MILDFTSGKNGWGHAMHGSTMTREHGRNIIERLRDWVYGVVRYSFMIHHPENVYMAEKVMWTAKGGVICGSVYRVEHSGNVDDMWTIYVCVRPEDRQ